MVGLCELIDVPFDEVRYWSAGVNHQAWVLRWERDGRTCTRCSTRHRRRPGAAPPGAGRHVPAARLLPDRDQRALREYVPWYLHDHAEIERLRIKVGEYVGSARPTSPSTPQVRAELATPTPSRSTRIDRVRPAGDPLLETGTPA